MRLNISSFLLKMFFSVMGTRAHVIVENRGEAAAVVVLMMSAQGMDGQTVSIRLKVCLGVSVSGWTPGLILCMCPCRLPVETFQALAAWLR